MSSPILHTTELSMIYPHADEATISKANLEVNKGDIVLLLGENGAGKSTLLRGLSGLQKPHSGDVFIDGKPLKKWSNREVSKKMALVLTQQKIQGMLSVEEFVAFGRYPFTNWLGRLTADDKLAIEKSLERCSLEDFRTKKISELSDGEKQRVFLARALAQQAELLILDEPTTHLDVKHTTAQLKLFQKLIEEDQLTLVFSSHQFDLALQIATKLWLIEGDKVHQLSPNDFYEDCVYQEILLGEAYRYDKSQRRFRINL